MSVLILKSSILGQYSKSNNIIDEALAGFSNYQVRDLAEQPVPVLDGEIASALSGGDQLNSRQQAALELSDKLVAELQTADSIVIAAPMYNFMIPVQLKSYFDLIARAGVTFKYTDTGAVGLLENKKVIVVTSRGGVHQDTDHDHVTNYMKTMLGFLGLTDIDFIFAEALDMEQNQAAKNKEKAIQALKKAFL